VIRESKGKHSCSKRFGEPGIGSYRVCQRFGLGFRCLGQGELDLAVISTADEVPNIHFERVGTEPLHLAVAAGHRLAGRKRVALRELADEPFVLLHDEHCLAKQVQEYCVPHGLRLSLGARGAQLHTIARMVSLGLGVSVLPEMFRAADTGAGRVYVRFAEPAPERVLCMAWSLLRYRTNAARAFAEAVRAEVVRQRGNASRAGGRQQQD
jgi:DNA-binding transcriptional LysR family regulator